MWQVFGTICGIIFLSLVLLLFYWTQWEEDSEAHAAHIEKNTQILERFWNQQARTQGGKLRVGYKSLERKGFPFGMKIRLVQPYLQDAGVGDTFTLTIGYLDLIPTGDENEPYELVYPRDGYAIIDRPNGQRISYYLSLSETIPLWVRKLATEGRQSSAFNQFALEFSGLPVTLKIDRNNQLSTIPLNNQPSSTLNWQPMIRDARATMRSFRQFLQAIP